MNNEKDNFPIEKMAKTLGISKNSYYIWLKKKKSHKRARETILVNQIKEIFRKSDSTFGYLRVTKEIRKKEIHNKKKIQRIIQENSLFAVQSRSFRPQTTIVDDNAVFSPNLLNQNFCVDSPDKVWVSDITYIKVNGNFMYLCIIMDLYSRKIVGWSMKNHMKTSLLTSAFIKAIRCRNPAPGLIFHSDRGVQYTSNVFKKLLKLKKVIQSMSRTGNCYDNACAESFFSSLKREKIYRYKTIESISKAHSIVFHYIEIFYNKYRLHSFLNYKSPKEFEVTAQKVGTRS